MRVRSERTKFWLHWNNDDTFYQMKRYEKTQTFEEEFVHKFLWQDEHGKELVAVFEAIPGLEAPVLGLTVLSIARTDTFENVSVPEGLYREMLEMALVKISENEKDLLENVPAW